jgi:hypothetical protein
MKIEIRWIGGNCPVQGEGTIDGQEFYFRARGEHWSIGIGGDPVGEPEWYYEEGYGSWPDAGWMPEDEARAFIMAAAGRYAAREQSANLRQKPSHAESEPANPQVSGGSPH